MAGNNHAVKSQMPAMMSMYGTPQGRLNHTMQFVLTRWLPCTASAASDSCVEIVTAAVPDPAAVDELTRKIATNGNGDLDYSASTRMRLVVEPGTLRVFLRDTRRHSYLALTKNGKRSVEMKAEQVRSTVTYRSRQAS
jgi:hypothetical protein